MVRQESTATLCAPVKKNDSVGLSCLSTATIGARRHDGGGRGRGGGCSLRSNRKLKVDVLETILNNFAVVTRTLLVIRDFLIARRVCKLTYHNGSERSKRMVRGYVLRACATRSHQRTYEDSLLALCALRGSGRWAASSPDACVRAGAVRTRSGVGALSQEGSGVGALNML